MKTIALSISDRTIRFIEINEKREISFVDSIDTTFSFTECFKTGTYNEAIVAEAANVIHEAVKDKNFNSAKIGVLLDSCFTFINIIPIDYSADAPNIASSLLWDLSNYYPDNYKNFKLNYYRLENKKFAENVKDTLYIAIENDKLEIIKKIMHTCRLKAGLFDIDHFAVEKYIRDLYKPHLSSKRCLYIGCKRNRFDISIIDSNSLNHFEFIMFKETNYVNKLSSFLDKINSDDDLKKFDFVVLYGDDFTIDIFNWLTSALPEIKIYLPDPFTEMTLHSRVNNNLKFREEGNKFLPSCGLALKGL